MAFLSFLSIAESMPVPGSNFFQIWQILLLKVFDFVGNYGWRIVVFTICLKLVLSPLDVYQRVMMRKNQKITERIKPEMEKLKLQYAHDKQALAQKQMALNKREGFSYFSTCLPAIITIVIFFWLFSGLTNISQYMSMKQYLQMYDTYDAAVTEYKLNNGYENIKNSDGVYMLELTLTFEDPDERKNYVEQVNKDAKDYAQTEVVRAYEEEYKVSFLWIKNVWSPDVPWKKPILGFSQFETNIGKFGTDTSRTGLSSAKLKEVIASYDDVTKKLYDSPQNKTNGYLILPILSVGLTFLSQFITTRQQKKSGQMPAGGAGAGSMKYMMYFMPIMMGAFALGYTAIFTIYIITNSFMTLLLNLSVTGILTLISKRSESKEVVARTETSEAVVRYGRPDPNDKKVAAPSKDKKKSDKDNQS